MLREQDGQCPRFQRLEHVRHVARVLDVIARGELHRLAGHPDQGPAGAEHHVLDHAGHVRLGRPRVPGLGLDPVHVPARARRAPGEQRGPVVGFGRGDVITEINRQPINSVADYRAAVSKLKPGDDVVFKVLRRQDGDRMLTVYLSGKVPSENQQ